MAHKLTVLVHTRDEESQIEECLESVRFADEIYLIDSFSNDRTVEIVRGRFPQARIEQREYLGAASQKNWGIDRASNDWILVVDADERVTPELAREIRQILAGEPSKWAWAIRRRNFVLDKEIRFGGTQRDWVTRLFHRGHARYQKKRVHAEMDVDGPVGRMRGRLLHYNVRSLDHLMAKITRYGVQGATQLYLEGRRARVIDVSLRCLHRGFRDYILYFGFLDGLRGVVYAWMHAYYTFWKWAKLWEYGTLEKNGEKVPLAPVDDAAERWEKPWEKRSSVAVGKSVENRQ